MLNRSGRLNRSRNTGSGGVEGEGHLSEDRTDPPKRRRRKPEAAENEILDAAEGFLKEHRFRDMTVEEVMLHTGLSRPSFYEYFRDRHHLVMKLVDRFGDSTYGVVQQWLNGEGDGQAQLEQGIERLVAMYYQRGYLLRALADAATHDVNVEQAYRAFAGRFVEAAVYRIKAGIAAGEIKDVEPEEIASALIAMNERYLIDRFGRGPQGDPDRVARTILTIWRRVLYGA